MANPQEHAEAMYDHYDDVGVDDAATIRQQTGYEGDGSNDDFSAEAIRARNPELNFAEPNAAAQARQEAHDYYVQEFRLHEGWTRADDIRRQRTAEHIAHLHGLVEPTKPRESA
jgi:hypothetical protein